MPNIKIIGENESPQKKKVPIKFDSVLSSRGVMVATRDRPVDCKNIELICKNYTDSGQDLIFCYGENRNDFRGTTFYIGKWNDGVV